MNINWNRKYLTIAVYATCAVIVSAIAVMIIFNFDTVMSKLSTLGAIANPIIIGIFCAYLLNPLMTKLETGPLKKLSSSDDKKKRGKARGIALTITMLIVVLILTLIIIMVIPQLVENLVSIFSNMDSYINTIKDWLNEIFEDYPGIIEFLGNPLDDFNAFIGKIWKEYSTELVGIAGNVAAMVWAVLDTMKNVIIGLTISIYLLARKEMFIGQTKKLIFAFLKVERAQRFLGMPRSKQEVPRLHHRKDNRGVCRGSAVLHRHDIHGAALRAAYLGDNVRVQSYTIYRTVYRRYPVRAAAPAD